MRNLFPSTVIPGKNEIWERFSTGLEDALSLVAIEPKEFFDLWVATDNSKSMILNHLVGVEPLEDDRTNQL